MQRRLHVEICNAIFLSYASVFFFFHAKLPTSTRLSRSSPDFHAAPLCKFFLKVTAAERDIERPAWGERTAIELLKKEWEKKEEEPDGGKRGKNASVEKNYPIMPKARRNYERCYTWPGPALRIHAAVLNAVAKPRNAG